MHNRYIALAFFISCQSLPTGLDGYLATQKIILLQISVNLWIRLADKLACLLQL